MAGLANVPIVIRDVDDRTALELALVENLQRENLDPIEEAKGYAQLVDQFDLTQEEVAAKVGKNRATVANALRLIKLPPEVQTYMRDGLLSSGHAKVILGLKQAKDQIAAAKRVIKKELSVRQTEELLGALGQATPGKTKRGAAGKSAATEAYILSLEGMLRERLGTKVALRYRKGKGSVDIKFFNDEDLQRILETLGIKAD
jgi:ParB family chromosome partitioning protein